MHIGKLGVVEGMSADLVAIFVQPAQLFLGHVAFGASKSAHDIEGGMQAILRKDRAHAVIIRIAVIEGQGNDCIFVGNTFICWRRGRPYNRRVATTEYEEDN